ncbi:Suppressor of kinetochore protein 1 [Reticulomyxa filosa]|uniref:Suppressor of kinetochore protein 1 n=1 Tax=Reticulomyxa filosa TaxID=46433 RepID=X6NV46_RETFI|nr:Suppressor of kinetochore protein 1 [Reticulomyxa filosa]|eukprot:ETO29861.1 Suppressor of kinetochore protein 1 [Reticulomyxa filosa]
MSTEEKKEQQVESTEPKKEEGGLDDDGDDEIVLKTVGEDGKDGKSFSIKKIFDTLENIVKYLNEHKGEEPPPLPCPVRSTEMSQIVSVKWDAEFIDAFDKKAIFEIILVRLCPCILFYLVCYNQFNNS